MSCNRFEDCQTAKCARRVSISVIACRSTRDVPHHLTRDDVSVHCRIEEGKGRSQKLDPPEVEFGDFSVVVYQVLGRFIHEHGYSSAKSTCAGCNTSAHSKVPEKVEFINFKDLSIIFPAGSNVLIEPRIGQLLLDQAMGKRDLTPSGASPLDILWALCPPVFAVCAAPRGLQPCQPSAPWPAAYRQNHKPGCFQEGTK